MTTTLPTQAPSFHALTGNQPVGQTQICVRAEYAGTMTSVKRLNTWYWAVTTRSVRNAFRSPEPGASAAIWFDRADGSGRYVVDYWTRAGYPIEAGRARSLQAAIGIACDSTATRWAAQQS